MTRYRVALINRFFQAGDIALRKPLERYVRTALCWVERAIRLANAHGLDLRIFIALSVFGTIIHGLYYLPCFKGETVELAFLVLLRSLALVGPLYILLKGKRIAPVLNGSLITTWSLYTAWHVCYFVYL